MTEFESSRFPDEEPDVDEIEAKKDRQSEIGKVPDRDESELSDAEEARIAEEEARKGVVDRGKSFPERKSTIGIPPSKRRPE